MTAALLGYKRLWCLVSFVVNVVCAIDADTLPRGSPTLTTAYSDGSHCIVPWERHKQSCYLFKTGKYDLEKANESCWEQGAQLVSISDDAENEFIKTERIRNSTDSAWIGLYRQTPRCDNLTLCDWMWLDGSQLRYHNWPSNAYASPSQCVMIEPNGFWTNGRGCNAELDLICKRDVWYPTTTSEATTMMMTTDIADPSSTNSTSDEVPTVEANKEEVVDDKPIIIGCVVGGLVLVAIVTVVVVVLLKRHRTSRPIDQPMVGKDEGTPKVDKQVRYNPAYEDVETNVTFKPSPGNTDTGAPGNTDTGAPGNTDTGAHSVGDNPHNIYSEAIKKQDRPGSEGILVKENTLYGYGK